MFFSASKPKSNPKSRKVRRSKSRRSKSKQAKPKTRRKSRKSRKSRRRRSRRSKSLKGGGCGGNKHLTGGGLAGAPLKGGYKCGAVHPRQGGGAKKKGLLSMFGQ